MKHVIWLLAGLMVFSAAPAFSKTDTKTQGLIGQLKTEINNHPLLSASSKSLAIRKMLPMVTDALWVRATVEQNRKGVSLAEIQKIDKAWINAEEPTAVQVEKTTNAVAKAIKAWVSKNPEFVEVFVMDDQGAVVGENSLTGDYWQGDEAKWKNSYKGKAGGLDVGKVKFDKSANRQLQQLSLPIVAPGGAVVGAVTFGYAVK